MKTIFKYLLLLSLGLESIYACEIIDYEMIDIELMLLNSDYGRVYY